MKLKRYLILILLIFNLNAFAKVVQIIHTNDLHSYFQGTRGKMGGYAQLKEVIDELKSRALDKGIPTLYLDGGDFGEGSSFYFSNHGVDSLKALDILGVDVTVLGNHDYLLGTKELKNQIRQANLKAKIISANIKGKKLMGLKKLLPDFFDYNLDGMKIRIFGLTTNEIHYMYPLRPLGYVSSPHKTGLKQARRAKKDDIDFTIALTHIGLSKDIELVHKSRSIDMIIGGHSHTLLQKPEMTKNLEGRTIPILQAGAHSGYVGAMLIDIQGQKKAQILDYKMINIKNDMPENEVMGQFVRQAYQNREAYFGRNWEEIIGQSEITLSGNINGLSTTQSGSCWSRHVARLTRQVTKADLGLQFDVFQGEQIPPGPITFGDLIDNFPHVRKWGDKGWKMGRARISGFILKKILSLMANSEVALQVMIDGVSSRDKSGNLSSYNPSYHSPDDAIILGEEINNLSYYSIGLPWEVPYGVFKLANFFSYIIFQDMTVVENSQYWPHLENYIRNHSPLRCLKD
jgi:2',3'-cyclic-nucleotide 2'-phosphodiesterase (5'-nucleotidase family)